VPTRVEQPNSMANFDGVSEKQMIESKKNSQCSTHLHDNSQEGIAGNSWKMKICVVSYCTQCEKRITTEDTEKLATKFNVK